MGKNLFYPAFQMETVRPLGTTCLKSAKSHNSISAGNGADQKCLEGRRGAHLSTSGQFCALCEDAVMSKSRWALPLEA